MEFVTCVRQAQSGGTSNRSIARNHGGCNQCMIQVIRYLLRGRLRHGIMFTQLKILESSGLLIYSTPFTWVWLAASSDLASFFCQSWRVQLRSTIVFRLCLLATFPGVRVSRNVVLSPRSRRSMSNGRRRHRIHQAAGTKAVSAQFSCSGCRIDTTVKVHLGTECLQLLVKLRYQRIGSFVSSTTGKHGCRLKRQQKRASCVLISWKSTHLLLQRPWLQAVSSGSCNRSTMRCTIFAWICYKVAPVDSLWTRCVWAHSRTKTIPEGHRDLHAV